ncbi:MAG: hypothetical protein ABR583_11395 [Gaiellaceae bacterium]
MAFRTSELERRPVLEHGTTRASRWFREYRVRVALWIALAEGLLILFGPIPRLPALVVAVGLIALYFALGRRLRWQVGRQASWIAAASQAFVALVPLLLIVVSTLALIALGLVAVAALVLLFGDRR